MHACVSMLKDTGRAFNTELYSSQMRFMKTVALRNCDNKPTDSSPYWPRHFKHFYMYMYVAVTYLVCTISTYPTCSIPYHCIHAPQKHFAYPIPADSFPLLVITTRWYQKGKRYIAHLRKTYNYSETQDTPELRTPP